MSQHTLKIGNEDAAEHILRRVQEEQHGRVETPSAEQVAMVLRALSDLEHNSYMLSGEVEDMAQTYYSNSNWRSIQGLHTYFRYLADNVDATSVKRFAA